MGQTWFYSIGQWVIRVGDVDLVVMLVCVCVEIILIHVYLTLLSLLCPC